MCDDGFPDGAWVELSDEGIKALNPGPRKAGRRWRVRKIRHEVRWRGLNGSVCLVRPDRYPYGQTTMYSARFLKIVDPDMPSTAAPIPR